MAEPRWKRGYVQEDHPITVGAIVRGNYSEKEYRVEFSGDAEDGTWWIQARDSKNHLSTAWFSFLGDRVGDEIEIKDERRPDDKLLVIFEKKPKVEKSKDYRGQLSFSF